MNNLKQYAGLLNEAAPKNHFLAYITPKERDMLVDAGGVKTSTQSGIFAYPPGGGDWGGGMSESGGGKGGGGWGNSGREQGASRNRSQTKSTSTVSAPAGGASKLGNYGGDSSGGKTANEMSGAGGSNDGKPVDPGVAGTYSTNPKTGKFEFTPSTDTITSFSDNLKANLKSNPFGALTPTSTLAKTAAQTLAANYMMGNINVTGSSKDNNNTGGGGERLSREQTNQLTSLAPFLLTNTVAPKSQVASYFKNLGATSANTTPSFISTYNNAKNKISQTLNLTPNTQQFGYTANPNSGFSSTPSNTQFGLGNSYGNNYAMSMTSANPFFDALKQQGLI